MAWTDALNRNYLIETSHTVESIVNALKDRIERAKKVAIRFSFESIQYQKMEIDDYRLIIKSYSNIFKPFNAKGVIMVHFKQVSPVHTQMKAEIKPMKSGLWIALVILILMSVLSVLVGPPTSNYIFLMVAWVLVLGVAYLGIAFFRYGLKAYLKEILADVGVNDYSFTREN